MSDFSLTPIAYCHSPFKQKFGVPHQSGLLDSVEMRIQLEPEFAQDGVLKGLEQASHIWLIFLFHECVKDGWRPTVQPPRLPHNLGVFASRSPHRPNHIGLSVVELITLVDEGHNKALIVRGADMVDQTPIVDIKPYLPQGEGVTSAHYPYESCREKRLNIIEFSKEALAFIAEHSNKTAIDLKREICEVLQLDPRPRQYRKNGERSFGFQYRDVNISWRVSANEIVEVLHIVPCD